MNLSAAKLVLTIAAMCDADIARLIADVRSPDIEKATEAVSQLGKLGAKAAPAVDALIEALADRRSTKARSFRRYGSAQLRELASRSLEKIGVSSLEPLRRALKDPKVQLEALETLGRFDESAEVALPDIKELLQSKNPDARSRAAWVLGRIGVKARVAKVELRRIAASDPKPLVRLKALEALTLIGLGVNEQLEVLLIASADSNPNLRAKSAELLGELGPAAKSAVPVLIRLLDDTKKETWSRAPDVKSDGTEVFWHALNSLERIGPLASPAIPRIRQILKENGRPHFRLRFLFAILDIDPDDKIAREAIRAIAFDSKASDSIDAIDCIGAMRKPPTSLSDTVVSTLDDKDPIRRWHAIGAMKSRPDPEAVALLIKRLTDVDTDVRVAAIECLGSFGKKAIAAESALRAAQSDKQVLVRTAALKALEKLQSKEPDV